MKCYVIQHLNGKFVAGCGGDMPYLIDTWYHATMWSDEKRARDYMKTFSSEPWGLVSIEPKFQPAVDRTNFGISMECVHTRHCCAVHGCKYGDKNCPVENKVKFQGGPCEYCDY